MFFKLPDEVCVIRRKRSLKIRQVDKICCCVLLTSTYFFKKMHLGVVDFKIKKKENRREGKRKSEREGEKL